MILLLFAEEKIFDYFSTLLTVTPQLSKRTSLEPTIFLSLDSPEAPQSVTILSK